MNFKKFFPKNRKTSLSGLLLVLVVVTAFQNCARGGFQSLSSTGEMINQNSLGGVNPNGTTASPAPTSTPVRPGIPTATATPIIVPTQTPSIPPTATPTPTPTPSQTGVVFTGGKHFGYYWVDTSIVNEVASQSDIAMSQADSASIQVVADAGLKAVVHCSEAFFYFDANDSNRLKMYTDYKQRWKNMYDRINSKRNYIFAFYPADEPFWNGINHGVSGSQMLTYMNLVGATIKADFPTIPLMMIEAYPMIDASLQLPASFDIFGFDCYDGWDQCGAAGIKPGYVPQSIPALYETLKSKVTSLSAMDGRPRKMAVIPPSSFYVAENGTASMTEETLRGLADKYLNMAKNDPMIYVMINFVWNSFGEGGGTWKGLKTMSKPTKDKYKYISNEILGRDSTVKAVSAIASRSASGAGPEKAIDGNAGTAWNAGDHSSVSPQWLQVDLGAATTMMEIRLRVSQSPAGATIHEIWGGPTGDETSMVKLDTLSQVSTDGQVLISTGGQLSSRSDIRFLRIKTVNSPSWVSWWELDFAGIH